jgi:hypothetical protein
LDVASVLRIEGLTTEFFRQAGEPSNQKDPCAHGLTAAQRAQQKRALAVLTGGRLAS